MGSVMNEYVAALRKYVTENPPNYGSDAHSILDMLYCYYHECNNTDTEALKTAFEDLYLRMHGIPFGKWIGLWMPSAHSAGSMRRPDL